MSVEKDKTLKKIMSVLSGFENGKFSTMVGEIDDATLVPIVDKLNRVSKALQVQAQAPRSIKDYILVITTFSFGIIALFSALTHMQSTDERRLLLQRELRFQALSHQITYLDEVLTMTARLGALTGDQSWLARYKRYEPILDQHVKDLIKEFPEFTIANQTDIANQELVKMEQYSFDISANNGSHHAYSLLMGKKYSELKLLYSTGMADSEILLKALMQKRLATINVRTTIFGISLVSFLALTLVGSFLVIKRLISFNSKLLSNSLSLERKVNEKTQLLI